VGEDGRVLPARAPGLKAPARLALVALAAAAAWLPTPQGFVERAYSTGLYAAIERELTPLSNRVPFALFDALIVVVAGAWLALAIRDAVRRRGAIDAAARVAARTIVWAAALYLVFLLAWGLNYRRVAMTGRVPYDVHAVTPDAARTLALAAADRLNALHDAAHATGWPAAGAIDPVLAGALARADAETGGRGIVAAGRPKTTLLDWYFRRTAVDGMTDPYFLETLVSSSLLPFERPFVVAHEWSHLAGVADEGDANFLGWLACMYASPPSQYSGWLFLYTEVTNALRGQARADAAARLGAGPRADLLAIRRRVTSQLSPRLASAGRGVYDRYLKANRVEAGVDSYARVVQMVLGVRFGPDWTIPR
jgi:hypothetical protein